MMHDGSSWGSWSHFVPGFAHGLYGLLILVLIIGLVVVLIRSLFRNKERLNALV